MLSVICPITFFGKKRLSHFTPSSSLVIILSPRDVPLYRLCSFFNIVQKKGGGVVKGV